MSSRPLDCHHGLVKVNVDLGLPVIMIASQHGFLAITWWPRQVLAVSFKELDRPQLCTATAPDVAGSRVSTHDIMSQYSKFSMSEHLL